MYLVDLSQMKRTGNGGSVLGDQEISQMKFFPANNQQDPPFFNDLIFN
jgi:hypothetical protein